MSPQELLDRLTELFPDFASRWNSSQNCFRGDDASFSHCGAFAEFGHFFQDHYEVFPKDRIKALGVLLSDCMRVRDSELYTAAATCFLENVAGERLSDDFRTYLDGEPLAFFSLW